MYSARWTQGLRQGDIVGPVLYPRLRNAPDEVEISKSLIGNPQSSQLLQMPADERFAVIVSHDCDVTAAKGRSHVLLARIREFDRQLSEETRQEIRAANDAVRIDEGSEDGQRYEYIDTFVLDPLPGSFDEPMLVQFTTITSWPIRVYDSLVAKKKAELEHEHRVQLRNKLGFFLGRAADDEPDEDKFDAPTGAKGGDEAKPSATS